MVSGGKQEVSSSLPPATRTTYLTVISTAPQPRIAVIRLQDLTLINPFGYEGSRCVLLAGLPISLLTLYTVCDFHGRMSEAHAVAENVLTRRGTSLCLS